MIPKPKLYPKHSLKIGAVVDQRASARGRSLKRYEQDASMGARPVQFFHQSIHHSVRR